MDLFKIKLKTKNGNDIKNKQTMCVYLRCDRVLNVLTKKYRYKYTYKIIDSYGVTDPKKVLELKDNKEDPIVSEKNALLKIVLNLFYIIKNRTTEKNISPDFILFFSPDLRILDTLLGYFFNPGINEKGIFKDDKNFKEEHLQTLFNYISEYPNTKFIAISNLSDKKYTKSQMICDTLKLRFLTSHKIEKESIDPREIYNPVNMELEEV